MKLVSRESYAGKLGQVLGRNTVHLQLLQLLLANGLQRCMGKLCHRHRQVRLTKG